MRSLLKRTLIGYLVVALFWIGITPRAFAGLAPSEIVAVMQGERDRDLQKIQEVLEMKMIRERLQALGFTAEEVQTRLRFLDETRIHQIALQLDDLKVGGNGAEAVIVILLIAVLIVLLIYVTGHRIVVK